MTTKRVLVCDVCEKNGVATQDFSDRLAVERVTLKFSSGGSKAQDLCGTHLTRLLDLMGDKPDGDNIACEVCGKTYQSKSGLRYHMETDHGDPKSTGSKGRTKRTQPLVCPVKSCGRSMIGPQGMAAHMRSAHPDVKVERISADEGVILKKKPRKRTAARR